MRAAWVSYYIPFLLCFNFSNPICYAQSNSNYNYDAFAASFRLEKEGDYTQAFRSIDTIRFESKDLYFKYLRSGWLKMLEGDTVYGMFYYSKAADQIPNAIEPKEILMGLYMEHFHYGKAEAKAREILKLNQQHYYANYNMGHLNLFNLNYYEAVGYFKKNILLYPNDYNSSVGLMTCYIQQGKKAAARKLLHFLLRLYPEDEYLNHINSTH